MDFLVLNEVQIEFTLKKVDLKIILSTYYLISFW